MNVHDNFGSERKAFNASREEYFQDMEKNPLLDPVGNYKFPMDPTTKDRMQYVDMYGNPKTVHLEKWVYMLLFGYLQSGNKIEDAYINITLEKTKEAAFEVEDTITAYGYATMILHTKTHNLKHKILAG